MAVELRTFRYADFNVTVGPGWEQWGEDPNANAPFIFAKADGVGALQFTLALFRGGTVPNPSGEKLLEMALNIGRTNELGEPFDEMIFDDAILGAGASFHAGEIFHRFWYLSDGKNFLFATYTCDWDVRDRELAECEWIVQSIQFHPWEK